MPRTPLPQYSSTQYPVLSTQYSVPSTQYPVLSTQYSVPSTQYSVLGTQYSVLGTQYSVLSTRYSVLGTRYSVSFSDGVRLLIIHRSFNSSPALLLSRLPLPHLVENKAAQDPRDYLVYRFESVETPTCQSIRLGMARMIVARWSRADFFP